LAPELLEIVEEDVEALEDAVEDADGVVDEFYPTASKPISRLRRTTFRACRNAEPRWG